MRGTPGTQTTPYPRPPVAPGVSASDPTPAERGAAPAERPAPERLADGPVVLGAGSRFDGVVTFRGRARIDGDLRGDVVCRGTLRVGPSGHIEGSIEADELLLEGTLRGDAHARARVELGPTARVEGAILSPRVLLTEGARIDGRVEMPREPSTAAEVAEEQGENTPE